MATKLDTYLHARQTRELLASSPAQGVTRNTNQREYGLYYPTGHPGPWINTSGHALIEAAVKAHWDDIMATARAYAEEAEREGLAAARAESFEVLGGV